MMNLLLPFLLLAALPAAIDDVELLVPAGDRLVLSDYADRPLVAIVFLGTECPLARLYAGPIEDLAREFPDVPVIGVMSNRHDSLAEIAQYVKQHKITFPVVKDVDQQLAERLGATRTPEAFLLDRKRHIIYRGRIDERFLVGAQRADVGRRHLAEAIREARASYAAGDPKPRVTVAATEPRGCFIDRDRPEAKHTAITWADVQPIFQHRCATCHRPDQTAPFSLLTYEDAAGWADTIAEVVQNRRMPPWHADPRYGKFANDRSLSDDERERLLKWIADGAVAGTDSPTLHSPPSTRHSDSSIRSDHIVAMRVPFKVPATGIIEYQTIVIDPGFTTDRWIKAAEVIPGNRAVLHHATIFLAAPNSDQPVEAGVLGSFCFATWVPGAPATAFPPGMAKKVPAGWKFVFMLHYVTNGSPQTDQTKLALTFADPREVQQEVATQFLFDPDIRIAPHERNHVVEKSWTAPRDVLLLAMFPHMHLRGRTFQYEVFYPNGTSEILLRVPNYDFNWQHRYELIEPKPLPAGTLVKATAHYDNSADNPVNPDPAVEVRAGQQTTDEMFNAYFDIAAPIEKPKPRRSPIIFGVVAIALVWLASRFACRSQR
jgi:peroxiredoxin/mono/diheme cytochrome c family protein